MPRKCSCLLYWLSQVPGSPHLSTIGADGAVKFSVPGTAEMVCVNSSVQQRLREVMTSSQDATARNGAKLQTHVGELGTRLASARQLSAEFIVSVRQQTRPSARRRQGWRHTTRCKRAKLSQQITVIYCRHVPHVRALSGTVSLSAHRAKFSANSYQDDKGRQVHQTRTRSKLTTVSWNLASYT